MATLQYNITGETQLELVLASKPLYISTFNVEITERVGWDAYWSIVWEYEFFKHEKSFVCFIHMVLLPTHELMSLE